MPDSTKGKTRYQALVHMSVSRSRGPNDPTSFDPGADLVLRGGEVWLDDEAGKAHLDRGTVREWDKRNEPLPRVTARDITGQRFPGPLAPNAIQAQAKEPEETDPQPQDQGEGQAKSGTSGADPYQGKPQAQQSQSSGTKN